MKQHLKTDFTSLKEFVLKLNHVQNEKQEFVVSQADMAKELKLLKQSCHDERFFFVIDIPSFSIEYMYGVEKWLGYNEKIFSLKQYWDKVVHAGFKKSLLLISYPIYELLCVGNFPLNFLTLRFSGKLALRHYKGHYLLVKKTSTIFQFDTKNRLIKYIDEFTIIGEFNEKNVLENSFTSRFYNAANKTEEEMKDELLKGMTAYFNRLKIFSATELQIARKIAYSPGITKTEIAKDFSLSPSTIQTFCNRFLEKARTFFNQDFPTTEIAALYLKQEGLL